MFNEKARPNQGDITAKIYFRVNIRSSRELLVFVGSFVAVTNHAVTPGN